MEKVVVIDALSFIGFHLCSRLLEEGIEVTAIDDLEDGKRQAEKEEKLHYFGRNALFTQMFGKREDDDLYEAFNDCDVCFQICALSSKGEEGDASSQSFYKEHNILARLNAVGVTNQPHLLLVSSTDVYDKISGDVQESTPVKCSSAEKGYLLSESYHQDLDLPIAILRMCEVYGPWQPEDRAIARMIRHLSPHDDADDFVYIDDVIDAMYTVAKYRITGIFNITSGKPGQWQEATSIIYGDQGNDHGRKECEEKRVYRIEKAYHHFGYEPRVSLKEGISRQISYMNRKPNADHS